MSDISIIFRNRVARRKIRTFPVQLKAYQNPCFFYTWTAYQIQCITYFWTCFMFSAINIWSFWMKSFPKQIGTSALKWELVPGHLKNVRRTQNKNISEAVIVTLIISINQPTQYTFCLNLKEHSKYNFLCNIFRDLWLLSHNRINV